jgi:hypothetical protein
MYANKQGCTQMARSHGHWVGCEPMSVQPESACIPAYPRASAFHLALPQAAHALDWRRNARSVYGTAVKLWCAPDRSAGTHQLVGRVPLRLCYGFQFSVSMVCRPATVHA